MEDLPHLVEEFIVLVFHLPARGRVDPHCFVLVDEVVDARAVRFIRFDAMVRHNNPKREEQFEDLAL